MGHSDHSDKLGKADKMAGGKMSSKTEGSSGRDLVSLTDSDVMDADTRCGYGKCTPDCLQPSANPKALLAVICWFIFVQSFAIIGINNVNTTTMERRFEFSSEQVAWISSAYDVAGGCLAVVIGYLGSRIYKGRLLASCAFVLCIGSLLMFLPHFLIGPYELGQAESDFCDANGTDTCAGVGSSSLSNWLYMFIVAQLLHAVGGTAIYTLAVPYVDENVSVVNTPLYVGIFQAFGALGPAVGFIGGGALLNIYVDIDKVDMDTINITPEDPRWVGAWWIGFMISCCGAFSIALFMACFPRELPAARRLRLEREARTEKVQQRKRARAERENAKDDEAKLDGQLNRDGELKRDEHDTRKEPEEKKMSKWKEVGISLKGFFTTPSFIFLTLGGIVESGAVVGFATFLPKVIQFQFAQSPSQAAFLAGVLTVPGAAGGQLIGGAIPKCLKLKPRGLLMQTFICSMCGFALSFCFLMSCDMPEMAGINVPYFNQTDSYDLMHPCNQNCTCTTESYNPLCYGGLEYFSPCHAGCLAEVEVDDGLLFTNCSCINTANGSQTVPPSEWHSGWGEAGTCPNDCTLLAPFLVLFFLLMLVTFISNTSGQSGTIRCIKFKDRAFGFGVQWTLIRFLGNVPGPIILGKIFDSACWMWQEKCGSRGSCWIYDNSQLSVGLCIVCMVVKGFSSICFGLATLFFKPLDESNEDISLSVDTSDMISTKSGMTSSDSSSSDDDEDDKAKSNRAISMETHVIYANAAFISEADTVPYLRASSSNDQAHDFQTKL